MSWYYSLLWLVAALVVGVQSQFRVGRGIADVTGLASEVALYGYARIGQTAQGVHMRQYARAFIFDDSIKRVAIVVAEISMFSQAVHDMVLSNLTSIYGNVYNVENVMLTATHSHAAPGGHHTYWMYQLVSGGFATETFDVLVSGIVKAIQSAHNDLEAANVFIDSTTLLEASINRSPYAYEQNPQAEQDKYTFNVENTMTVLKILNGADAADVGLISFYPVHGTSLKNYNHLVSSDNKGYAAQLMERYFNPGSRPGQGSILAAFAQTAAGDVSPNTNGERCENTNEFCSYDSSVCPENVQDPRLCTGRGPDGEQFEDMRQNGDGQFRAAQSLYLGATEEILGPIDYRAFYVNMSAITITNPPTPDQTTTCRPGMGYSFVALSTDGPGIPPFVQAMTYTLDIVANFSDFLGNQDEAYKACHAPRPVLFASGVVENPWQWQPEVLLLQLLRIGSLALIGIPMEVTTMAGRRLTEAVQAQLGGIGVTRTLIVSMTNNYGSYVTTYEEYQVQRYEAASNTYGPLSLHAFTQLYEELAVAMATGATVPLGSEPVDLYGIPTDAYLPIKYDATEDGAAHGSVIIDTLPAYLTGETASATFVAGNPRHNLKTDATFLEVQHETTPENWVVMFNDGDFETRFYWETTCELDFYNDPNCTLTSRVSNATITWDIPSDTVTGVYRLVHYGHYRVDTGEVYEYRGESSPFDVSPAADGAEKQRHPIYDIHGIDEVLDHYDNPYQMYAYY